MAVVDYIPQERHENFTRDELTQKLKIAVQECIIGDIRLKMKIRRGSCFRDFSERLEKKWISDSLGNDFFIEFYGEVGD